MEKTCCAHKAEPKKNEFTEKLVVYRPLIVIFAVSIAAGAALAAVHRVPLMDGVMGFFLLFIAVLKLFDIKGFAASFAKYDLVAARIPAYGTAYPFLEATFGVLFISGLFPLATNAAFALVMIAGTAGVLQAVRLGKKLHCACAGSGFSLPVGRVTILENMAMLLMALTNLSQL